MMIRKNFENTKDLARNTGNPHRLHFFYCFRWLQEVDYLISGHRRQSRTRLWRRKRLMTECRGKKNQTTEKYNVRKTTWRHAEMGEFAKTKGSQRKNGNNYLQSSRQLISYFTVPFIIINVYCSATSFN